MLSAGHDVATLRPLLVKMATAISELSSKASASGSDFDVATVTVAPSVANLGCSIYLSYQSYCKVGSFDSSTHCIGPSDLHLCGATASSDLFASCACYSSTYWVPNLYDNAIFACNEASSTPDGFSPTTLDYNGTPLGFCNYHNPRNAPTAYGLDAKAVATSSPAAAAKTTAAPATTPASPASPTKEGSTSSISFTEDNGSRRLIWALMGLATAMIIWA